MRDFQVWRHRLGSDTSADEKVYEDLTPFRRSQQEQIALPFATSERRRAAAFRLPTSRAVTSPSSPRVKGCATMRSTATALFHRYERRGPELPHHDGAGARDGPRQLGRAWRTARGNIDDTTSSPPSGRLRARNGLRTLRIVDCSPAIIIMSSFRAGLHLRERRNPELTLTGCATYTSMTTRTRSSTTT